MDESITEHLVFLKLFQETNFCRILFSLNETLMRHLMIPVANFSGSLKPLVHGLPSNVVSARCFITHTTNLKETLLHDILVSIEKPYLPLSRLVLNISLTTTLKGEHLGNTELFNSSFESIELLKQELKKLYVVESTIKVHAEKVFNVLSY